MSREFNPRVSIIIPVYNGSNYISEAIDSALSQTYKNIEIVVVNDGSNDDGKTHQICESYGQQINYFYKKNGGVASALNFGIEKMNGEYFSWLSHDDLYYPQKIEKQINELSQLKDKRTIIYSGIEIIDERGQSLGINDFSKKYERTQLNKSLFPFFNLLLNGCTMLVHKTIFKDIGIFDTKLPTTQDYDLWFRILRESKIFYSDEILVKSRSHPEQSSKAKINAHIQECNEFWLNVFNSITKKEIKELYPSELEFYMELYKSFKEATLYSEVILFLEGKALEYASKEYFNEIETQHREEILLKIHENLFGSNIQTSVLKNFLTIQSKKKPRLLFFTGNWSDRGGINRVISVVSSILSSSYEIFVCCIHESGNVNGYKLNPSVKLIEIEESDFSFLPQLQKLIGIDIFIGSNNCFAPLLKMYPTMEDLGIKVIMWNHENYFFPLYKGDYNNILRLREEIYKKVSIVLWLSKGSALIGSVFNDNSVVMENPLSFSSNINQINTDNFDSGNLISVARYNSYQKRIDRLIRVFAKILEKRPKTKLYIVGPYDLSMKFFDGYYKSVSDLIKELRIPKENLIFIGEVKKVEKHYPKAAINVLTSEYEGFGVTILEAGFWGLPSVIFSGSGSAELITDGIDGYVIKDGNEEVMADKIVSLLSNLETYKEMSKNAEKLALKYEQSVIGEKWKNLINELLTGRKTKNIVKQEFSAELLEDAFITYEKIILEKSMVLERRQENVLSKFKYKLRRLRELIKVQGYKVTLKNLSYKIKSKLVKT